MGEKEAGFIFNPQDELPIYRQLSAFMKKNIREGNWKQGAAIPSENEICTQSGISRTTVRLAFRELINDGLLIRRRGLGSFVTDSLVQRNLNNLYSFTEDMRKAGKIPSSRVLERKIIKAGSELADKLRIRENMEVFCIKRIRCADANPVLTETTYIPYTLCPGIETENFEETSLYALLSEKYHTDPFRATETFEAIVVPQTEAAELGVQAGTPAFLTTRTGFLSDESIFEYTESIAPGNRCRFEIGLNGPKTGITFQRGYPRHV